MPRNARVKLGAHTFHPTKKGEVEAMNSTSSVANDSSLQPTQTVHLWAVRSGPVRTAAPSEQKLELALHPKTRYIGPRLFLLHAAQPALAFAVSGSTSSNKKIRRVAVLPTVQEERAAVRLLAVIMLSACPKSPARLFVIRGHISCLSSLGCFYGRCLYSSMVFDNISL